MQRKTQRKCKKLLSSTLCRYRNQLRNKCKRKFQAIRVSYGSRRELNKLGLQTRDKETSKDSAHQVRESLLHQLLIIHLKMLTSRANSRLQLDLLKL